MNADRWVIFGWGCLGSFAVEVVAAYNVFQAGRRLPAKYRRPAFWVTRLALGVMSGLFALAYDARHPILAVHIGAATPLIVRQFAHRLPHGGSDEQL